MRRFQALVIVMGLSVFSITANAADCGFPTGTVTDVLHLADQGKPQFKYSDQGRQESVSFESDCSKIIIMEKRQNYQTSDEAFEGCSADIAAKAKKSGFTSCIEAPILKTSPAEAKDLQRGESDPSHMYLAKVYAYVDNNKLVYVQNWPTVPRQATLTLSSDGSGQISGVADEPSLKTGGESAPANSLVTSGATQ
jgi:hypothetical protein